MASPWYLLPTTGRAEDGVLVSMAGTHQIWRIDLATGSAPAALDLDWSAAM